MTTLWTKQKPRITLLSLLSLLAAALALPVHANAMPVRDFGSLQEPGSESSGEGEVRFLEAVQPGAANPAPDLAAPIARTIEQLRRDSLSAVRVRIDEDWGTPSYISGRWRVGGISGSPREHARAFLDRYGAVFHGGDRTSELVIGEVTSQGESRSAVHVQQRHRGVDVVDGNLVLRFEGGFVKSIQGRYVPGVEASINPRRQASQLKAKVLKRLAKTIGADAILSLSSPPSLALFVSSAGNWAKGVDAQLVWRFEVQDAHSEAIWTAMVDTKSGRILHADHDAWHAGAIDTFHGSGTLKRGDDVHWYHDDKKVGSGTPPDNVEILNFIAQEWHEYASAELGLDSYDGKGGRINLVIDLGEEFESEAAGHARGNRIQMHNDFILDLEGNLRTSTYVHEFNHLLVGHLGGVDSGSRRRGGFIRSAIEEGISDALGDLLECDRASASWSGPELLRLSVCRWERMRQLADSLGEETNWRVGDTLGDRNGGPEWSYAEFPPHAAGAPARKLFELMALGGRGEYGVRLGMHLWRQAAYGPVVPEIGIRPAQKLLLRTVENQALAAPTTYESFRDSLLDAAHELVDEGVVGSEVPDAVCRAASVIGLNDLSQSAAWGARSEKDDRLGEVLAVGDFDGDGRDDVALGIPGEDDEVSGNDDEGAVLIFRGSGLGVGGEGNFCYDGASVVSQSWGEADDRFGASLATGEFLGLPQATLAVGQPGDGKDAGVVHLLGKTGSDEIDFRFVLDQAVAGATVEPGDRFGEAVAAADIDGDGHTDLIVGSPGEDLIVGRKKVKDAGLLTVFYAARPGEPVTNLRWERISMTTLGRVPAKREEFGSVLETGDFNGDGFADVVVGVPQGRLTLHKASGYAQVLYGSPDGLIRGGRFFTNLLDASSYGGANHKNANFGASLAAGDLDGDGCDDLAIGAPRAEVSDEYRQRKDAGQVVVLYSRCSSLAGADYELLDGKSVGGFARISKAERFGTSLAVSRRSDGDVGVLAIGSPGRTVFESVAVGPPVRLDDAGTVHLLRAGPGGLGGITHEVAELSPHDVGTPTFGGEEFGSSVAFVEVSSPLEEEESHVSLLIGAPGVERAIAGETVEDAGSAYIATVYGDQFVSE